MKFDVADAVTSQLPGVRSADAALKDDLADLLTLLASSCQTQTAMVAWPDCGRWFAVDRAGNQLSGPGAAPFARRLASAGAPMEVGEVAALLSEPTLPPALAAARWAYGIGVASTGDLSAPVVAVLDVWVREVTGKEFTALRLAVRRIEAVLHGRVRPAPRPTAEAGVEAPAPSSSAPAPAPAPNAPRRSEALEQLMARGRLLRSNEVAELFDVTERTVLKWASAGKLRCVRTLGGQIRFRDVEVLPLLDGRCGPNAE